jgi:hypothetical protein
VGGGHGQLLSAIPRRSSNSRRTLFDAEIHDWGNENSLQIVGNVRAAMNHNGRVLIVEAVVPDDDREHVSQSGFRHTRTVGTVGPASIVEAVAV